MNINEFLSKVLESFRKISNAIDCIITNTLVLHANW